MSVAYEAMMAEVKFNHYLRFGTPHREKFSPKLI